MYTQGVQVILKMESMNLRKKSMKSMFFFCPSEARFHILLEARSAMIERGPKGLS